MGIRKPEFVAKTSLIFKKSAQHILVSKISLTKNEPKLTGNLVKFTPNRRL